MMFITRDRKATSPVMRTALVLAWLLMGTYASATPITEFDVNLFGVVKVFGFRDSLPPDDLVIRFHSGKDTIDAVYPAYSDNKRRSYSVDLPSGLVGQDVSVSLQNTHFLIYSPEQFSPRDERDHKVKIVISDSARVAEKCFARSDTLTGNGLHREALSNLERAISLRPTYGMFKSWVTAFDRVTRESIDFDSLLLKRPMTTIGKEFYESLLEDSTRGPELAYDFSRVVADAILRSSRTPIRDSIGREVANQAINLNPRFSLAYKAKYDILKKVSADRDIVELALYYFDSVHVDTVRATAGYFLDVFGISLSSLTEIRFPYPSVAKYRRIFAREPYLIGYWTRYREIFDQYEQTIRESVANATEQKRLEDILVVKANADWFLELMR